jgi:hypothetical protein
MEMGFATMAAQLTNGGHLDVRLGNVAQWSPENRAQALSWIRAGFAKDSRPVFLDAYLKPFATRAEVPGKVDAPPVPLHGFMDAIPQEIKNLAAYIPTKQEHLTGKISDETLAHVAAGTLPDDHYGKPAPKDEAPKHPPLFVSANKGPTITPDFARIVESVYASDAFADYDDLEKNLEVGEQRGDYLTLREHLDKAEMRARRAHKLLLGAKLERSNWERDAEVTAAGMRRKAAEELEDEKADGTRKKMITDADVTARVAELFPDEWRAQEQMRHKIKGTESTIEHLVGQWNSKPFSLKTLLETLRK